MRLLLPIQRNFSCSARKFDAAYDGPGKTTVKILNENADKIMIDGFSRYGFVLNNKMRVTGPTIIMPDAVLHWKIKDTLLVTPESFCLFDILDPKPDIVFFGYGSKTTEISSVNDPVAGVEVDKNYVKKRGRMIANIIMSLKKKSKLNIEALPTEDAISAYNFLVHEDRLVACALIPPEVVNMIQSNEQDTEQYFMRGNEFGDAKGLYDGTGFDKQDIQHAIDDLKDFQEFYSRKDSNKKEGNKS